MKKIEELKLTRYEDGDFIIDIENHDDMYEAWLRHREYGVAHLMFGVCKSSVSCIREFADMVERALPQYEKDYLEEV